MTNVNKKTAGKNKDSEKTTESKSPVTVKQMPDGTFEFSGGRGGFNIVAQKNKALEPYGKCIWNYWRGAGIGSWRKTVCYQSADWERKICT